MSSRWQEVITPKHRMASALSIGLVVCLRGLSPYLFVERISTLAALALLLGLVASYILLWGRLFGVSWRNVLPDAVLLVLTLSGTVVVFDPYETVPPRWFPDQLRQLPAILGVLAFLFSMTAWSTRILSRVGTRMDESGGSRAFPGWNRTFYLPVPLYLLWSASEGAYRGRPIPLIIVLVIASVIYIARGLSRLAWAAAFERTAAFTRRWTTFFWENDRAFAFLLALFAFSLRAVFAYRLNQATLEPIFLEGPDSGVYDITAWRLASGQMNLLNPNLWIASYNSGPSLFYALIYKVIGHRPEWVRFGQAGLASLTIVLLFRMGVAWFGPVAARIGAFLVAGRGYLVAYGTYLGSETLGLLLLTLLIVLMLGIQRRRREGNPKGITVRAGCAGLLLGGLVLTRPEYQLFLFAGIGWLWLTVRPKSFAVIAAWTLGTLLILLPMMARNYVSVGRFSLVMKKAIAAEYGLPSLNPYVKRPTGILDMRFLKEATLFVWESPLTAARVIGGDMANNLTSFWHWKQYVFNPAFVYFVRNERVILLIGAFLTSMFVLALWASRNSAPALSLPYLIIGYKTLVHLLLENNEWWRFTMEPFVNLFQGFGIYVMARYIVKGCGLSFQGRESSLERPAER